MHKIITAVILSFFSYGSYAAADLRMQIIGPTELVPQGTANYQLLINNIGDKPAQFMQIIFNVDPNALITSVNGPCKINKQHVTCFSPTIGINAVQTVTIALQAPSLPMTLNFSASITAQSVENTLSNNQDIHLTEVDLYSIQISPPQDVEAFSCYGENHQMVFADCAPGSHQATSFTLAPGGIVNTNHHGYTGEWAQTSPHSVTIKFFNLTDGKLETEWSGVSVSYQCFEGEILPFKPASPGAFRMCLL